MYRETIIIPSINKIERGIRRLPPDLAYFLLTDPDLPTGEGMVAKIYFEPDHLRAYLESSHATTVTVGSARPSRAQAPGLEAAPDADDAPPDDSELEELKDLELIPTDSDEPDDDAADDRSLELDDPEREYTHQELLEASILWFKEQVELATNDCQSRSFVLRAYAPKGSRVLMTASCTAENRAWRPPRRPIPPPPPPGPATQDGAPNPGRPTYGPTSSAPGFAGSAAMPSPPASLSSAFEALPSDAPRLEPQAFPPYPGAPYPPPPGMLLYPSNYHDGTLFGTQGAFRALNECYESFGRTMVNGTTHIQNMMSQVVQDLGRELHNARDQVSSLVESVLDHRVQQVEAQAQAQEAMHQVDRRTALAQGALEQIGEAARAFLMSRGLTPQAAELVSRLSSHPGLMATLQEPEVQELLSEPQALDMLAHSLHQVSRQHKTITAGPQGTTVAVQPQPGLGAQPIAAGPTGFPGAAVQPALGGAPPMPGQPGAGYPVGPGGGGFGYPSGHPSAPGSYSNPGGVAGTAGGARAQVAVSPGLAARAAARSIYSSQPGPHHGPPAGSMPSYSMAAAPWPGASPQPLEYGPTPTGTHATSLEAGHPLHSAPRMGDQAGHYPQPMPPPSSPPARGPSPPERRAVPSRLPSAENAKGPRDDRNT